MSHVPFLLSKIPLRSIFKGIYGRYPELITQAPGRINIIGEHTDYNLGNVLPAPINYYMNIGVARNETYQVNIYAVDFDESYTIDLDEIKLTEVSWLNLVQGVFYQLKDQNSGVDVVLGGNVPVGAGLSSSTALCCGTAMALSEFFELTLDKWSLARIAQKSEHDFAGVPCGIIDQFASLLGQENHELMLDCDGLKYEAIPIDMSCFRFVLLDSKVKHQNRGVYRVDLPTQEDDFEWYISAKTDLGDVVYPSTASASEKNHRTVLVIP